MTPEKQFDCVEMKWEIQQKLRKEYEGMSPEEARQARRKRIEEDPVLGPFLRDVKVVATRSRT